MYATLRVLWLIIGSQYQIRILVWSFPQGTCYHVWLPLEIHPNTSSNAVLCFVSTHPCLWSVIGCTFSYSPTMILCITTVTVIVDCPVNAGQYSSSLLFLVPCNITENSTQNGLWPELFQNGARTSVQSHGPLSNSCICKFHATTAFRAVTQCVLKF